MKDLLIHLRYTKVWGLMCVALLFSCKSEPTSPTYPQFPSEIIASVNVGPNTSGVCCTPDGSMVIIAVYGLGDYLKFVDTEDFSVIASVPIDRSPGDVCISNDGAYVYCSHYLDGTISVVSVIDTMLVTTIYVGGIPDGLTLSDDGELLYIANYGDCTINVIDTFNNTVIDTLELQGSPTRICLSNSGEYLYAISTGPYPRLYKIQIEDLALLDSLILDSSGSNLLVTPDDEYIYSLDANKLLIVNSSDLTVSKEYAIHSYAYGMTILNTRDLMYVCGPIISGSSGNIYVYELDQNSLEGQFEFPDRAYYFASSPTGDRVYVSCGALYVLGE